MTMSADGLKPALPTGAYHVAVVTVLNVEFVAMRTMLDERHQRPVTPNDPYLYATGSINGHNVVVTCAGEAGPGPTNHCATQLMRTFENIKIGVLVGIGGGVPSEKHDIRLGDVVVSRPGQGHGGVYFYDAGKLTDDGFELTGHLNRPPLGLSNAVNMMQADLELGDTQFRSYLEAAKAAGRFSSEGLTDDLYMAGNEKGKVIRQPRDPPQRPKIHHGLIASGSWVIKTSGSKRDDLVKRIKDDVLCFEMEAAGLMNTFPCLVVRGISDYCDSHKNDGWHTYAATAAACYCKWLLAVLPSEIVQHPHVSAAVGEFSQQQFKLPQSWSGYANNISGGMRGFAGSTYGGFNTYNEKVEHNHYLDSSSAPKRPSLGLRNVNPTYVGREQIAAELHEAFFGQSTSPGSTPVFVIYGLGGTGKSEVCLKYARDHESEYWGRFWIDCTNLQTAETCFHQLAEVCRWPEIDLETIRSRLSSAQEKWLLILDNADNPDTALQAFIPSSRTGHVIITSRDSFQDVHATVGHKHLEQLGGHYPLQLLCKASGITLAEEGIESKGAANQLLDELGSHTLAIVQAGAYIKTLESTRNGFQEYLKIYRQQRADMLKKDESVLKSQYGSVYATFEVSSQWLIQNKEQGSVAAGDALELIHFMAFTARTGYLTQICSEAMKQKQRLADHIAHEDSSGDEEDLDSALIAYVPDFLPSQNFEGQNRWREAVKLLRKFSIVTVTSADADEQFLISMHVLVHAWAKERQTAENLPRVWLRTACTLALSASGHNKYSSAYDILKEHVRACIHHDFFNFLESMPFVVKNQLIYQLAYIMYHSDDHNATFAILKNIIKEQDRIKAFADLSALEVQLYLLYGVNLVDLGETSNACAILKDLLVILETKLAEDHSSRLESQYELARAYLHNGQTDKAIELLEYIVAIEKKKLAKDHPSRLASQDVLALAYLQNGQTDKAIELLEHIVAIKEKKLAKGHPSRLASQHALAFTFEANGQFDKAIETFDQVVRVEAQTLVETHYRRLDSQLALANAYAADDQHEKAYHILDHVVKVQSSMFEKSHPQRFQAELSLTRVCLSLGYIVIATDLCTQLVDVADDRNWSYDSCPRQASLLLVQCYLAASRKSEAIRLSQHILETQKIYYSPGQLEAFSLKTEVANILSNGNVFEEAVTFYESALDGFDGQDPDEHTRIQITQFNLAVAYEALGRVAEAVTLWKTILAAQKTLLEPGDPSLLLTELALKEAEEMLQQQPEAEALQTHKSKKNLFQYVKRSWKKKAGRFLSH